MGFPKLGRRALLGKARLLGTGVAGRRFIAQQARAREFCGPLRGQGTRPNILFILADQMRGDAMGCAGNPDVQTPNLDWLAATGNRFSQAYCATPVCVPARVSLISSQYPHASGCKDNSTPWLGMAETIPELLARAGYQTVAVGKRHFGRPNEEPLGFQRIVEIREKGLVFHDEYFRHLMRAGLLQRAQAPLANWQRAIRGYPSDLPEEHYIDAYIGQRTIQEIQDLARGSDPWFLWAGFPSPHPPTDPPEPWASMYANRDLTLPAFSPDDLLGKPMVHTVQRRRRSWVSRGAPPGEDPAVVRNFLVHYYGLVSLVDHWVGRLVSALEDTGQLDNTLIVFSADHGAYAGNHGELFKGFALYDCLNRIPLIVRWPGYYDDGAVIDAPVEHVDLLPTLLDLAGVEEPWGRQGYSLHPLLLGSGSPPREFAFSEYHYQKMIRRGRYKLIAHVGKSLGELYDLAEDPGERVNRWMDSALTPVREELTALVLRHLVASETPGAPFRSDFSNARRYLSDPTRGSL